METDDHDEAERESRETSVEEAFKDTVPPPWQNQITIRSMVASFILSIVFSFIVCKLNLTTGIIPSLNVAAGLLGFALLKGYTALLSKFGLLKHPFTRQENTVIQTCVVASSGIAFSSGTASYLLGMTPFVAKQADDGNTAINTKALALPWMIGFLFLVSFVGLFSIITLRKMMIIERKLTYPSGTATALLINSFHTPNGAKKAKKQVFVLFISSIASFLSPGIQWVFAGGDDCGFASFPIFGLGAFKKKTYFDFSATYIGCGMITSYLVNLSMLVGGLLSWFILWPWIETKKGTWYSADLSPTSLHGIQGYRVFITIALILGDGLFNVVFHGGHVVYSEIKSQIEIKKAKAFCKAEQEKKKKELGKLSLPKTPISSHLEDGPEAEPRGKLYDEEQRNKYFLKDEIPNWFAGTGYVALALLSSFVVPVIFHQIKWYHILVAYLIAPVLAFCNSYGCGLTDWSLVSSYGKLAIIIFSAWVGLEKGGVVTGLVSCGVMMNIVSTASDLMQDFKTGYLTLASPRAMFASQVAGTAMGCVVSPLVFWFFYKSYNIGDPNGAYPAPYGLVYRGIALLGVEGIGSLPKNCLGLAIGFFGLAILINVITEILRKYETKYRLYRFVPIPMAMAIPLLQGNYFVFDMCLGSLILAVWRSTKYKQGADEFAPALASGLICGDSIWGVPSAIMSFFNINPPICMKFLSSATNKKVDAFLSSIH